MPVDPDTRRAADAIRARARTLATTPVADEARQDADVLGGLAAGSVSLAEVDDDVLERLVDAHGTDAIVRAILSADDSAMLGNRLPTAPAQDRDERRRPAEVLSFPRRVFAGGRTKWLAAAASILITVAVGTTIISRYGVGGPDGTNIGPRNPARTAVLIKGDDRTTTSLAETTILRALADREGVQALDADGVSQLRGDTVALDRALADDFGPLDEIGRRLGLEVLVVGDLKSRAAPSTGPDYAGTAELRLIMYRLSTGRIVDSRTFVVGPGGAQTATAVDEAEARLRAAQEAVGEAVDVVRSWLVP